MGRLNTLAIQTLWFADTDFCAQSTCSSFGWNWLKYNSSFISIFFLIFFSKHLSCKIWRRGGKNVDLPSSAECYRTTTFSWSNHRNSTSIITTKQNKSPSKSCWSGWRRCLCVPPLIDEVFPQESPLMGWSTLDPAVAVMNVWHSWILQSRSHVSGTSGWKVLQFCLKSVEMPLSKYIFLLNDFIFCHI